MTREDKYGMRDKSNEELVEILLNRQESLTLDVVKSAKRELEYRNIDMPVFVLKEKSGSQIRKIDKSKIIAFFIVFFIFFCGFGIGGIFTIVDAFKDQEYFAVGFGIVISSIGFLLFANNYLSKLKWLINTLMVIPLAIMILALVAFIIGAIFCLFYLPFFEKSSLDADLGILILKDGFVRFLMILFGVFLSYMCWKYAIKGIISSFKEIINSFRKLPKV